MIATCETCKHWMKLARVPGGVCNHYPSARSHTYRFSHCRHHVLHDDTPAIDPATTAALRWAGAGAEASPPEALAQMREREREAGR